MSSPRPAAVKQAPRKSSVTLLRELKSGRYNIPALVPIFLPCPQYPERLEFKITYDIDGERFVGQAKTINEAKYNALENAPRIVQKILRPPPPPVPVICPDKPRDRNPDTDWSRYLCPRWPTLEAYKKAVMEDHLQVLLWEQIPELIYHETTEDNQPGGAVFRASIEFDGITYRGEGQNSRAARNRAAMALLEPKYRVNYSEGMYRYLSLDYNMLG